MFSIPKEGNETQVTIISTINSVPVTITNSNKEYFAEKFLESTMFMDQLVGNVYSKNSRSKSNTDREKDQVSKKAIKNFTPLFENCSITYRALRFHTEAA